MTEEVKPRVLWIDTAKSLGILLVFWGHIVYNYTDLDLITRAIYSFHMPMYFILSGMVMVDPGKEWQSFLKHKILRLVFPVIIAYILFTPLFILLENSSLSFSVHDVYFSGAFAHNPPLWFFICLFEVYVLSLLTRVSACSIRNKVIICVSSFLLAAFIVFKEIHINFLGIDKAILAFAFFSLGVILKNHIDLLLRAEYVVVYVVIWFVVGVLLNGKVSMYGFSFDHFPFYLVGSLCGSLMFYWIAKQFSNIGYIRSYSRYTVFIIVSHYLLVVVFMNLTSFENPYTLCLLSLAYVIVCLIIYLPVSIAVERCLPILNGRLK